MPSRGFFLQSFLLFQSPKIRGAGPRSPPLDPPLLAGDKQDGLKTLNLLLLILLTSISDKAKLTVLPQWATLYKVYSSLIHIKQKTTDRKRKETERKRKLKQLSSRNLLYCDQPSISRLVRGHLLAERVFNSKAVTKKKHANSVKQLPSTATDLQISRYGLERLNNSSTIRFSLAVNNFKQLLDEVFVIFMHAYSSASAHNPYLDLVFFWISEKPNLIIVLLYIERRKMEVMFLLLHGR